MPLHDPLSPGDHRRILWDSLPKRMFIDLSRLETFRSGHVSLLLKTHDSIPSMALTRHRIGELPFGHIDLITCGDVPVAYNVNAPSCVTRVGRNFAALMLRGKPPLETRRLFVDGTLVVLGDDSALVVTTPTFQWIRGSGKEK